MTVEGRDRDGARGCGYRLPGLGGNERLVAQSDDDSVESVVTSPPYRRLYGRGLAFTPATVLDHRDLGREHAAQVYGARNNEGLLEPGGQGLFDGPDDERSSPEVRQELVLTAREPAGGARGQDNCCGPHDARP